MNANTPRKPTLKITGDGSHTLYSEPFDQDYHNVRGAVTESKHVFLKQNGLMEALKKRDEVHILEIGFGTGLNLLLLMDYYLSSSSSANVTYCSIEAYPISAGTASNLNYSKHLHHPELADTLPDIFKGLNKGRNSMRIIPGVDFTIFYGLFDDYTPDDLTFDFIFHDAFSPEANPELWTGQVFKKLLDWSDSKALLTTYCAASKARGAMALAGWKVARAEGILGKREMTVASPSKEPLAHLKRINEQRLAKRYEEDDF